MAIIELVDYNENMLAASGAKKAGKATRRKRGKGTAKASAPAAENTATETEASE